MKNLILFAAVIFTLSANATNPVDPANQKVMTTFTEVFKDAHNVSWSTTGKTYEAYFTDGAIKTRALLTNNGVLVQTVRYYGESELPANILYSVKKTFRGKEVYGVTEVTNKYGVNYRIVLRDAKHIVNINANSSGDTEVVSTYSRGDK